VYTSVRETEKKPIVSTEFVRNFAVSSCSKSYNRLCNETNQSPAAGIETRDGTTDFHLINATDWTFVGSARLLTDLIIHPVSASTAICRRDLRCRVNSILPFNPSRSACTQKREVVIGVDLNTTIVTDQMTVSQVYLLRTNLAKRKERHTSVTRTLVFVIRKHRNDWICVIWSIEDIDFGQ
jgi:hypothetical protein